MKKIATIIIILISGCYTIKVTPIADVMNNELGLTENNIVLKYGAPSRTTDDGAGGKILVYEKTSYQTKTNYYRAPNYNTILLPTATSSSNTNEIKMYINFFINKDGIVYNWRTNYPDIREKIPKQRKAMKEPTKGGKRTTVVITSIIVTILTALFVSDLHNK